MRWPGRWDEELLNQNAKRGTQKRKERTPTPHTWPGAGKPWKGKGKRKAEGRRTRNKTSGGGGGRKRLNQPDTAKTYKHLSTRRSQPTWGGKNAWDRGPMGISWWNHKKLKQDSVPNYLDVVRLFPAPGPWSSLAPIGIKQLSSSIELGAQHVSPHQTTKRKETTPESHEPAWVLCHGMMQCSCKSCCKKGGFWQFRTVSLWQTGISARRPWDYRSSEIHQKRWITERPTVSLYLNELLD